MKSQIFFLISVLVLVGCQSPQPVKEVVEVAAFQGQQVTGVTVSGQGRLFVNFPRWRKGVNHSVVEVEKEGTTKAYPDARWNAWEVGQDLTDSVFVAVQSVVVSENELFVLDTRNPLFQGVKGQPHIFVFDLTTDQLKRLYPLPPESFHPDSYINDLRVDRKKGKAYFTDSGNSGLVVLDLQNGQAKRVLDEHPSTQAETDHLMINGEKWNNTVHTDGIALDTENDRLYYHALTGYTLYSLPTAVLIEGDSAAIAAAVKMEAKTAAPDGMIFDEKGNLYYADLEHHKIRYRTPAGETKTLVEGESIKWADTFSIYAGELYFTNSRIHEASGDISQMSFTVNKVSLAD